MDTVNQSSGSPFVKLDEQVSLASSSERVVKTTQVGRVIGFGCDHMEQEALESLKGFAKNARENPKVAADPNFKKQLRAHVQNLETKIASSLAPKPGKKA